MRKDLKMEMVTDNDGENADDGENDRRKPKLESLESPANLLQMVEPGRPGVGSAAVDARGR